MRKYSLTVLAAAAIGLTASVASAADLPRKAPAYQPPPPPPPFSWTGFYLGVAGGGGWGTSETRLDSIDIIHEESATFLRSNMNGSIPIGLPWDQNQLNGWLAGGTVGYNWQANPWLVLGIEGDFDWADIHGTTPCGLLNVFSCSDKVKWTADVTGRLGFAVDRALLYLKGGVVWADVDRNTNLSIAGHDILDVSGSDTRVGGLFGAGVEYAFLPNWSAKIEYNFMDFGTHDHTDPICFLDHCDFASANTSTRLTVHTVKAGVNYRFDWGRY